MLCLSGFELYSRWVPLIFADQVFIDPTFFGIFVCGPLQSFVVNVCTLTGGLCKVRGSGG